VIRAAAAVVIAAALATACANDGPDAAIERVTAAVVAIESQRCENPNRAHGQGVIVGPDLVVTAGHVVEGTLRSLTVDGQAAVVVAIDRNADLALVAADLPDFEPPEFSSLRPADLVVLGPDGPQPAHVESRERLVIEHATDLATYRREVIAFTPGVIEGMSGSPVVDDQGRLAGIVILEDEGTGEGIAVVAGEVSAMLEDDSSAGVRQPTGSC